MAANPAGIYFMVMLQSRLLPLILLGTLTFSVNVVALTSDGQQPFHIQADTAVMDAQGSSVYRGNVIIEQGTLQIKADEIEIITNDSEVIQIIASTDADSKKLAQFEQLPDDSEDRVYAEARKITYLVQEEKLHLSGKATLKQTKDILTGELVYYDISQGIMSLKSNGQNDRINVTINPKAN
ncbi:MAG: lipopolysaccharide transport periplasmic protein LptA [Gammaproteobacteria bacterium]|nr:lipopolysaccharide transport periplasmic protein LptA [Gammaproteobacteria bacterium]